MPLTLEQWSILFGVAVPLLSFAGSWAAGRVHHYYLRRDVDSVTRSVRAAHWRLDEIQAPPAPTMDR